MSSIVQENYLKALYFLDRQSPDISITDLSQEVGVSKPTANNMVRNLQKENWLVYEKYKPVRLTESGRKRASLVIRKHRLTEMFLERIMGFGWEEVHEIAEQIEHINSESFFNRMDEMLDYPSIDPHGSPIPNKEGDVISLNLQRLLDLEVGEKGVLQALARTSQELLNYLNSFNIQLGTKITLISIQPYDASYLIQCDEQSPIHVSKEVAERLLINTD